jgi:hypothetical protein
MTLCYLPSGLRTAAPEAATGWEAHSGEDIDLGYRLHRAGARFVVDRRTSALHYPHEKSHYALAEAAVENYRYIAQKYATPITKLLNISPTIDFLQINDVILAEGIPTCAEYRAGFPAGLLLLWSSFGGVQCRG